ncbi:uncharacterized protein isoform X1 [Leptinotarsa decemlineata]|uniref:uncharacterized protein isoform X1 n=1 Tax=Leptinotarsa decemlineata TaxID=7539 RepID=UPI003D307356
MFKNVKVNYPKRKTALQESKVEGIQEPVRETMYDILLENFHIADRKTFIHRIIYVGEHHFSGEDDTIIQCFQKSVNQVNESFCLEPITGFLLCYRRHFVHMIEGDEDSINSHLHILLNDKELKQNLGVMKLLIHVSHINRRYISDWASYKAIPPKLLGQIDPNSSLEDSGRQIYNCIKKVYNLVATFVDENYFTAFEKEECSGSINEDSLTPINYEDSPSRIRMSQMSFRPSSAVGAADPYRAFLPEVEVVNFIIISTFTQTLSDYYAIYGIVPQRDIYKDKVWPVPSDFVPYDVFTRPYETITELPKSVAKTEVIKDKGLSGNKGEQKEDVPKTSGDVENNEAGEADKNEIVSDR